MPKLIMLDDAEIFFLMSCAQIDLETSDGDKSAADRREAALNFIAKIDTHQLPKGILKDTEIDRCLKIAKDQHAFENSIKMIEQRLAGGLADDKGTDDLTAPYADRSIWFIPLRDCRKIMADVGIEPLED